MKNKTLIDLLTAGGRSEPEASDALDRVVDRILRRLRNGEVVCLPGLGRLVPGPKPTVMFEAEKHGKGVRRGGR